ncbi:MAG: histidine--tRNA ligase [Candidatus Sumerlaeia bacterium]
MPELELLKGTRDYLPQTQIIRAGVVDTLKTLFERYGFSPAETPVLNFMELLASKYAGGEEILKEIYALTDQGRRELGLRYDLTVPFARLVGKYQGGELLLPFKRYEIGRVFRDGPVKSGRLREFIQCDVDAVGIASPMVEAELLALASDAFQAIRLDVYCQINHVDVLRTILTLAGVPPDKAADAVLSIDKLKKIGREGVITELKEKGLTDHSIEGVFRTFDELAPLDSTARLERLAAVLPPDSPGPAAIECLRAVYRYLNALGSVLPVNFEPSLARGLQIYTGPIFEFFLTDPGEFEGAVAAGGRYDEIIGRFLFPNEPSRARDYPAAGLSFGLEPITMILESRSARAGAEGRPLRRTVTRALILPMGDAAETAALQAAGRLRAAGIPTEVDAMSRRARKAFSYADRLGIPFVMVIGEDEISTGRYSVKRLADGEQRLLGLDEAIEWISKG